MLRGGAIKPGPLGQLCCLCPCHCPTLGSTWLRLVTGLRGAEPSSLSPGPLGNAHVFVRWLPRTGLCTEESRLKASHTRLHSEIKDGRNTVTSPNGPTSQSRFILPRRNMTSHKSTLPSSHAPFSLAHTRARAVAVQGHPSKRPLRETEGGCFFPPCCCLINTYLCS